MENSKLQCGFEQFSLQCSGFECYNVSNLYAWHTNHSSMLLHSPVSLSGQHCVWICSW